MYPSDCDRLAVQAMNQLHPDVIAEVQSRALYSTEEESMLGTVSSVGRQKLSPLGGGLIILSHLNGDCVNLMLVGLYKVYHDKFISHI